MMWILYKTTATTVINGLAALLLYDGSSVQARLNELDQLDRIITCIRQSYTLHPSLFVRQYTTIECYLEQHLTEQDWHFWLQITATDSITAQQIQGA